MQLVLNGKGLPENARKVMGGPFHDLDAAKIVMRRNDFKLVPARCFNDFQLHFNSDRSELILAFCDLTDKNFAGSEYCYDGNAHNYLCDVYISQHTFYNRVLDEDEVKQLYIKWFYDGKAISVNFISFHP